MKCFYYIVFLLAWMVIGSCHKENVLKRRNDLPVELPALSGVPPELQLKEISLCRKGHTDITFRCSATTRFTTNHTRLWVTIQNPDIELFSTHEIDSFYADTINWGGVQALETHNRQDGVNFYRLDTALMATGFESPKVNFSSYQTVQDREVIIHNQTIISFDGTNNPFDIEQGALKRRDHIFIGFRNSKTNDVYVVELEKSYTIKSICRYRY